MAQKITRYLLISLILSLGFGQLGKFDIAGIPLYIHDILVLCILLFNFPIVIKKIRNREAWSFKSGLPLICAGLILGWLRALTLFPFHTLCVPFLYTIRLCVYIILYVSLHTPYSILHTYRITDLKKVFILSGVITLAIALLQYFFLPDMRWAQYLGWDDHLNRLTLPHYDPTFTGIMLVLSLLIIFPSHSLLSILYSLLVFIAILLTYSRSVWLSLILTEAVFVKKKVIVIISIVLLLVSIALLPKKFGEGTNLLRTFSIESRFSSDIQLIQSLKWDLLVGRGYNTFASGRPSEKGFPNHATGPNNSFLVILGTMGVVGLLGWVLFLKNLYLYSQYKSAIAFILIASLFNNVLLYPFVLLWLFLVESICVND